MPVSFPIYAELRARDALTRASAAMFRQVEKQGKRAARSLNKSLGSAIGKAFSAGGQIAGSLLGGPAGALGGGLAGLTSALGDVAGGVRSFEAALLDLAVQGGLTDEQVTDLRKVIDDVSASTGLSRQQVVAAGNAVINLEGAAGFSAKKMELLAKASIAASAPAEELAGVVFALNTAFFEGKGSAEDMEKALSAVLEAGKQGSIPLNEMSLVLQQVASQYDDVAKRGVAGVADLAAALQVAHKGFGTASEAGTGLRALMSGLTNQAKILRASGGKVQVFEKVNGIKQLRPIRDIIDQISRSKLVRDPDAMRKAFESNEARRFLDALLKNRTQWDQLTEAAATSTSVMDDFHRKNASGTGKMRRGLNDVRLEIEKAFTPERMEAFVRVAGKAAEAVTRIVVALDKVIEGIEFLTSDTPEQQAQSLFEQQARAEAAGKVVPQLEEAERRRVTPVGPHTPEQMSAFRVEAYRRARTRQRKQIVTEARRRGLVGGGEQEIVAGGKLVTRGRGEFRADKAARDLARERGMVGLPVSVQQQEMSAAVRGIALALEKSAARHERAAERNERAAEKNERAASKLAREQRGGLSHGVR